MAQDQFADNGRTRFLADLDISSHRVWQACLLLLPAVLPLLAAGAVMNIDEVLHVEMARAMAERGTFHIAERGGVAASPELTLSLTHAIQGRVVPQYPSGYALFAAPLYAVFGLKGLIAMNAAGLSLILFATRRLALRLYRDATIGWTAVAILAFATFLSGYALLVLPHLATLGLVMIAVERAAWAADGNCRRPSVGLLVSGLCLGAAINFRVDAVLAVVAVLAWIRLFALPSHRGPALALLAGLLPGLMLASLINQAKFGHFFPISYGDKPGAADDLTRYAALAAVVAASLAAAFALDTSGPRVRQALDRLFSRWSVATLGLLALLAIVVLAPLRTYAENLYVLVVDLQHVALPQPGLRQDAFGFTSFYGFDKKALVQSLPFAMLLILPAAEFLSGRNVKAHALACLMIGAPLAFYSLNQWHGGLSANMRYFLPATPFIALLAAHALHGLARATPAAAPNRRHMALGLMIGAAPLILAEAAAPGGPVSKTLIYYAPLAAAAAIAGALGLWLAGDRRRRRHRLLALLLAIGFGQAAAAAASDAIQHQALARLNGRFIAASERAVPVGALVVTEREEHFSTVPQRGGALVNSVWGGPETARAAAHAFLAQGRCVILHGPSAEGDLPAALGGRWRRAALPGLPDAPAAQLLVSENCPAAL